MMEADNVTYRPTKQELKNLERMATLRGKIGILARRLLKNKRGPWLNANARDVTDAFVLILGYGR